MSTAEDPGLSLGLDSVDAYREYGSHHVRDVYAQGNARIFLGNADRVNLGAYGDEDIHPVDVQKLLLKALYYEVMNNRRNQIFSATKETCEWIWTSDFTKFLADPTVKVFWITGKPGSGKSTLMKYLASSLQTLVLVLPKTWSYKLRDTSEEKIAAITWRLVNFFFDFRMATKVGNSLEGLLRTLLYQFAKALPHLITHFAPDPSQYRDFSLDQLKAALDRALITLNDNRTHILILVDGLDEFVGKVRGLLDFLLLLSQHENVKLCMASRPESMIREKLARVQSLSVSNHNSSGIRRFIHDATSEFQPRLDALKLGNIQSAILTKALGVFLWVYYAVEETLQAYVEGATVEEIRELIMELPDELEAIYNRIVRSIPPARRVEAAILYTLISRADFDVSLELLQSALYLLINHLNIQILDVEDLHQFTKRLHATMGGLVDVITGHMSEGPNQPSTVRLMHETVKSFSIRSRWVESYIRADMLEFPAEEIWFRLGGVALSIVTTEESIQVDYLLLEMYERDLGRNPDEQGLHGLRRSISATRQSPSRDSDGLSVTPQQQSLRRLVHILHHSIIFMPPICAKLMNTPGINGEIRENCEKLFKSRLLAWHFALAKFLDVRSDVSAQFYDIAGSATLLMHHRIQHLLLASAYRIYTYLEREMDCIAALEDSERDELVGTIIASSFRWPQRGQREWIKKSGWNASLVLGLVDRILSYLKTPSSFHVTVYLVLGYQNVPSYIRNIPRRRAVHRWPEPQLPEWASKFDATEGGRLETWFPRDSPSYTWKSESRLHGQGVFSPEQSALFKSLGIPMIDSFRGQSSLAPVSLLEELLGPNSIRSYLVAYPSASNLANAIGRRVYQLEARGAPFPDSRITPIDFDWALFEDRTIFCALSMLQDLLTHRTYEGHLPQPLHTEVESYSQRFCNVCVGPYPVTDSEVLYSTLFEHRMAQDFIGIGGHFPDDSFAHTVYQASELDYLGGTHRLRHRYLRQSIILIQHMFSNKDVGTEHLDDEIPDQDSCTSRKVFQCSVATISWAHKLARARALPTYRRWDMEEDSIWLSARVISDYKSLVRAIEAGSYIAQLWHSPPHFEVSGNTVVCNTIVRNT